MAATIMTTAEVALDLDTTPRTLRKFLRSSASPIDSVGKGSRYSIEKKQIRSLRSRFAKWELELAAAREARADADADAADDAPADDADATETD